MKRQLLYIITIIAFIMFYSLSSCTGSGTSSKKYTYSDGKYTAEIQYYNPKTGTRSTYTLQVEIEDDLLIKIYWTNGGWLDNSHFTPPNISTGTVTFISDKNYRYKVKLLDDDDEDEDEICSNCGEYKDSYDDFCKDCLEEICPRCERDKHSWEEYCRRCEDKIESETCPNCGDDKYSWDELCNDCQEEEEEY